MKNAKKLLTLILALAMIFSALAFISCSDEQNDGDGTVTLVVDGKETKEYTVDITGLSLDRGLVSVLDVLKDRGELDYEIADTFLNKVGDVENDYTAGEYIYIFTSVEADFDVSTYAQTKEYKGQTLTSAGIGALEMTIEDGALIYITTVKW